MAKTARKSVCNLSGSWQGQYHYVWGKTVSFLAQITETDGSIRGETVEPKADGQFAFRTAAVSGECGGTGIHFTKIYEQPSLIYSHPVSYDGQVSDDRKTIIGRWLVLGVSGTFHMEREVQIEEETAVRETVSLDVGVSPAVRSGKG